MHNARLIIDSFGSFGRSDRVKYVITFKRRIKARITDSFFLELLN